MKPLNPNFCFTVKLNGRHVGGEFQYIPKLAGIVKLRLRSYKVSKTQLEGERTVYFRSLNGQWVIWDIVTNKPMRAHKNDAVAYSAFREAYGLAMIEE